MTLTFDDKHGLFDCADEIGTGDCANVTGYVADSYTAYDYFADGAVAVRERFVAGNGNSVAKDEFFYDKGLLDAVTMTAGSVVEREYYAYDAFGTRIAKFDYDNETRLASAMHDRDMEGRIVAERRRASDNSTDQFMSTYAHGVLGLISRTAEKENDTLTSDNEDFYYFGDAMGNHAGIINSSGAAHVREFDAFGYHRGTLILAVAGYYRVLTGPYMWRGGEGSETDLYADQDSSFPESPINSLSTGLVHMGVRYYEPETGRFTQLDPIKFGNFLTLNPYAYADSDPINRTDPTGLFFQVIAALVLLAAILAFIVLPLIYLIHSSSKFCWLMTDALLKDIKRTFGDLDRFCGIEALMLAPVSLGAGLTLGIFSYIFDWAEDEVEELIDAVEAAEAQNCCDARDGSTAPGNSPWTSNSAIYRLLV